MGHRRDDVGFDRDAGIGQLCLEGECVAEQAFVGAGEQHGLGEARDVAHQRRGQRVAGVVALQILPGRFRGRGFREEQVGRA